MKEKLKESPMSDFLQKFFELCKEYQQEIPPHKMAEVLRDYAERLDGWREKRIISKFGKLILIIGGISDVYHIAIPLPLLRMPTAQKYLTAIGIKLQFNIPQLG